MYFIQIILYYFLIRRKQFNCQRNYHLHSFAKYFPKKSILIINKKESIKNIILLLINLYFTSSKTYSFYWSETSKLISFINPLHYCWLYCYVCILILTIRGHYEIEILYIFVYVSNNLIFFLKFIIVGYPLKTQKKYR